MEKNLHIKWWWWCRIFFALFSYYYYYFLFIFTFLRWIYLSLCIPNSSIRFYFVWIKIMNLFCVFAFVMKAFYWIMLCVWGGREKWKKKKLMVLLLGGVGCDRRGNTKIWFVKAIAMWLFHFSVLMMLVMDELFLSFFKINTLWILRSNLFFLLLVLLLSKKLVKSFSFYVLIIKRDQTSELR